MKIFSNETKYKIVRNKLKIHLDKDWNNPNGEIDNDLVKQNNDNFTNIIKHLAKNKVAVSYNEEVHFKVTKYSVKSGNVIRKFELSFFKYNSSYNPIAAENHDIEQFLNLICDSEENSYETFIRTLAYIMRSLANEGIYLKKNVNFKDLHAIQDIFNSVSYNDDENGFMELLHKLYSDEDYRTFITKLESQRVVDCSEIPYPLGLYRYIDEFGGSMNSGIFDVMQGEESSYIRNFKEAMNIHENDIVYGYMLKQQPESFCEEKSLKLMLLLDNNIYTDSTNMATFGIDSKNVVLVKYNVNEWFKNNIDFVVDLSRKGLILDGEITHVVFKIEAPSRYNSTNTYLFMGFAQEKNQDKEYKSLLDLEFNSQKEVVDMTLKLLELFKSLHDEVNGYNYDLYRDIEDYVVYCNDELKVKDLWSLYSLSTASYYDFYEKLFKIFCIWLKKLVTKKYGEISEKEELLNLIEVRSLPPVLAHGFYSMYEYEDLDSRQTTIEYVAKFFSEKRFSYDSSVGVYYYNGFDKLPLNIIKKPFLFDKYQSDPWDSDEPIILEDGRRFFTLKGFDPFQNKAQIESFKEYISSYNEDVANYLNIIQCEEIVYSTEIDKGGMYQVVGYIAKEFEGEFLTNNKLVGLTNKEIYSLIGRYCVLSCYYDIPLKNIAISKSFDFYINLMNADNSFEMKSINFKRQRFLDNANSLLGTLEYYGYNAQKIEAIKKDIDSIANKKISTGQKTINHFDAKAKNCNSYCECHDFWYDQREGDCPICEFSRKVVNINGLKQIYDDEYARYYRYNGEYDLKVYKPSVDKSKIQPNVINYVNGWINRTQECFIPEKMAYNAKKEFIGYLYKPVSFNPNEGGNDGYCIDISDSKKLKNLPRLKCLIRLAIQMKDVDSNNYGFVENPYGKVFLHTGYKKQVQILNIEFLRGGITSKYTIDFIKKSITDDFFLDSKKIPGNLIGIIQMLQQKADVLTRYCSIHNMYYEKTDVFCPKCIDRKMYEGVDLVYQDRAEYDKLTPINQGGESLIYKIDDNRIVKVFNDKIDSSLKNMVLIRILLKRKILEEIDAKYHGFEYVMPRVLRVDRNLGQVFAYDMKPISDSNPISLLRDKNVVRNEFGFSRLDILQIIITIGMGIRFLHEEGLFIGDLNGNNILFDREKRVFFIDFDGMGIDELSPDFCTDGYIDPISKKNRKITMKDDWYSLAVQAFHYLTYTHPFNGVYKVDKNGTSIPLDIVGKMEKRISLLGNHDIKMPNVAEPWDDWMTDELKKTFLDIFEKEEREDFVDVLKDQFLVCLLDSDSPGKYRKFMESFNLVGKERISINSKFEAIEYYPYEEKRPRVVKHELSEHHSYDSMFTKIKRAILDKDNTLFNKIYKYRNCDNVYKVIFDKITRKWIIVVNTGEILVLKKNRENDVLVKKKFNVGEKFKVENVCCRNGKIFIPCNGYLLIVNENDQTVKRMECCKIMTPDSILYNFNPRGYCVMTNYKFFRVSKKEDP